MGKRHWLPLLALVLSASVLRVAVVNNGGFELGSINGWTCPGACTVQALEPYEGVYYASRAGGDTLEQTVALEPNACDVYRVLWASGADAASGSFTIETRYSGEDVNVYAYTPPLSGWLLFYLDIAPADPAVDELTVSFTGAADERLDSVALECIAGDQVLEGTIPVAVQSVEPNAWSSADLAIVAAILATGSISIGIGVLQLFRTR